MTDKEAIEVLKVAKAEVEWEYPLDYQIAFDKAIKALEQEPCEDCISRQAVLDVIEREEFKGDAISEIEKLSSVIPQSKIMPIAVIRFDANELHKILEEAINNIEIEPKWIPVNKQLPKESGKYLVTFGGTYHIGIDFYNTEEDVKKIFEEPEEKDIGWHSHNVVAWMPLPEPYKAESEG